MLHLFRIVLVFALVGISLVPPVFSRSVEVTPSPTSPEPGQVRLVPRAATTEGYAFDLVWIGPSRDAEVYGFALDLVLDVEGVVGLAPGSVVAGDALDPAGCAGVQPIARQASGRRIVAAVTKLGMCDGNGVGSGSHVVLSFVLEPLAEGRASVTLGRPADDGSGRRAFAAALDAEGREVESVRFDDGAVTVTVTP